MSTRTAPDQLGSVFALSYFCGLSKERPYFPEFREERAFKGSLQVSDAGRTAGTGLVTNDPFYRLHVAESPLLEPIFNVDQFLGELVQIKVVLRFAINRKPYIAHQWVRQVGLTKIAIKHLFWHRMAATGEEVQRFIV